MSSIPVYTGRWQDHSRNRILGDTVTLDVRWGGYLIAALSTFIGLVGTAVWSLLALAIHQRRAGPDKEDGVFFQQQVVYRNQGSTWGAFWTLCKICWAWRYKKSTGRRVERLKRRSFVFSLPPLLVFVAFTAAGIFIGEVAGPTYRSNSVLAKSARCGVAGFESSRQGTSAEILKFVNDTLLARQYSKTCYNSNTTLADCSLYPVQSLPYESSLVQCPFGNDPSGQASCILGQQSALQMDTGLLDTNGHLGINAAPENRLLLRYVVTCSPIRVQDYLQIENNTAEDTVYPLQVYNMGPIVNITGYTYTYDTHTAADTVAYQITPVIALDGDQTWIPVSALNVPNADISAHFLAQNSVQYFNPVSDPWLSANQLFNDSSPGQPLVLYGPDKYITVMACTDQYQICNPTTSDCTTLGSQKNLRVAGKVIGLNSYQLATADRLYNALVWTTTYSTVNHLGNTALLARDRLADFVGQSLPGNQWQIEVQGWFQTGLAKLQAYVVEYAANVADLGPYGYIVEPSPASDPLDQALYDMCSSQRIRNTGGYQSFSFLGLMVVICVGSTLILLSWIIEPIISCTRQRKRKTREDKNDFREIARIADQKLQLQRIALQGAGYGDGWERTMDEVPVATRGVLFPQPTRLERTGADEDDYCYGSAVPLLDGGGDGEEGADAPEQRPGMEEVGGSPLQRLSRPDHVRADGSQQPLVGAGAGVGVGPGGVGGHGNIPGPGYGRSEGSRSSGGRGSDLEDADFHR